MGSQTIHLLGRVASDVDMRYTPSGVPVTSFSFAINKYYTGKDGQRQEDTTFWRITCWQKLAEITNQYLAKGREAYIICDKFEARPYTDRDGNQRASLEATAREVQFVGGSRNEAGAEATAQSNARHEADNRAAIDEEAIPF